MNEQKVKKRGWVKNAAIIFLAVMLVLTFFSNTIMNRSLPEVAAQYVSSGTITAKIRGSGAVTANESYNVVLNQTRKVESVNVRVGDLVETGAALLTLSDAESTELAAAQDELDALLLSYEKAVINASLTGDYAQENRDIRLAREALAEAQATLAANSFNEAELAQAQTSVNSCQLNADAAQASVDIAQANLDALGPLVTGDTDSYLSIQRQITEKQNSVTAKQQELDAAEIAYATELEALEAAAVQMMTDANLDAAQQTAQKATYMAAAAQRLPEDDPQRIGYETINGLKTSIASLNTEINNLRQDLAQVSTGGNSAQYNQLSKKLADAKTALATANSYLTAAKDKLTAVKDRKEAWTAAGAKVKECQKSLEDLIFALAEKQKTDGVTEQLAALDTADLKRQVDEKREQIEKLESDSTGAVVTSPVSGLVKQINVSAGNSTESGSPVAVIEVTDRGYSLSFAVTNEQSKKVTVGDAAEVTNWWGDNVTANIAAIKNDPENPTTGKLLVFDITGDVQSGTQLSLSVGQRSADYDIIVPNSSLRNDTNGDFVLIVTTKSSPLGNRYTATRVDVKIMASDDTNSAVSGGLGGWDYVITTSNKPLEPGMLVRLAENS